MGRHSSPPKWYELTFINFQTKKRLEYLCFHTKRKFKIHRFKKRVAWNYVANPFKDSYLVQLDVHPLPAQEPGGLKGEDTRIQECILLCIGGEGQPSLTCRVEKGYASFPSQRNLMRH